MFEFWLFGSQGASYGKKARLITILRREVIAGIKWRHLVSVSQCSTYVVFTSAYVELALFQ